MVSDLCDTCMKKKNDLKVDINRVETAAKDEKKEKG